MTARWGHQYAEKAGWRVFPIIPGGKKPCYAGWQKDATRDSALIDRYWPEALNRNIAVPTGEVFDAWDIEAAHVDAFAAWMKLHDYVLPELPLAKTGRGGIHILTEPTGVNGSRNLYLDGEHIGELKSTGGFILVSPSVTTGQYVWTWAPRHMAVQPAPAWLLGLLERPRGAVHRFKTRIASVEEGMRALGALTSTIENLGEGKRNNYLYWAMRRAIEEGVPPRIAAQALRQAAVKSGLDDHEARQTLRSAYDAEGAA